VNATKQSGEPNHGGIRAAPPFWVQLDGAFHEPGNIRYRPERLDTLLAVYTGNPSTP